MSKPTGNLYRGWAIGAATRNYDPKMLILTVTVAILQVLGPAVMLVWAYGIFRDKTALPVWSCKLPWQNGTEIPLVDGCSPTDVDSEFAEDVQDIMLACELKPIDLGLKFVGACMLILLFVNGDYHLLRQDFQNSKLRRLYGESLRKRWMWTDALCNGWCIAATNSCMYPMLIDSGTIKDVILDTFGLLFLHNLDNYGGEIKVGIDSAEFDSLLQQKEALNKQEASKAGHRKKTDEEIKRAETNIFKVREAQGDWLISVARLANWICAWQFTVLHLFTVYVDHPQQWVCRFPPVVRNFCFPFSGSLMCLHLAFHFCRWRHSGKHDFISFFFSVILRRPDPRDDLVDE